MAEQDFARCCRELAERVEEMVGRAIVGQRAAIQQCLVAILARGHVLIEGVPGTAKTLLVRALAIALGKQFRRVQMTPDLMPSDIIGTYVLVGAQQAAGEGLATEFRFRPGPVFTEFLLADEINRAPAKTQSALLEAMQERQVTVDGQRHQLPDDFTVFATQNPVEFEGTYPLPEAQLDRFMMKVVMDYPDRQAEDELLRRYDEGFDANKLDEAGLAPVADAQALQRCRAEIACVKVSDAVRGYIVDLVRASRQHPALTLGLSPRAAVMLLLAAKTLAALRGKDYLGPDEVQAMAAPVWRHRIILRPEAEIEGQTADQIIAALLASVPVPR